MPTSQPLFSESLPCFWILTQPLLIPAVCATTSINTSGSTLLPLKNGQRSVTMAHVTAI